MNSTEGSFAGKFPENRIIIKSETAGEEFPANK